ncbi:bifunctional DNA primase/polymerase [Streptomyces sp. VNUA74]|uniref:bifunctional DNA primase/polymerase n=1 Tax=Streptomyces sp. VNUA74 TaxID=3062685 RepID=UPI00280AC7F8|nr:bifunctional DNA primase/polymerase [Streptomyces sp. VNUA74]WML79160.1 bifunctional DNA primase/polymerase [Streptomyces sp. VNUA74]
MDIVAQDHLSSTTTSTQPAASRGQQPVHWNPHWLHYVLAPKTYGNDGVPIPRRPLISSPANCGAPEDSDKYRLSATYWAGTSFAWDEAADVVSGAIPFMGHGRRDFGLPPQLNGLVVLDCDVKTYYGRNGGLDRTPYGPVYGTIGVHRRRGIDDLATLCHTLGHDLSELATYTVATPSGGLHLYFHQSLDTPVDTTSHHREGWLIDVIASENNWVAAPPTPGYRVARDYPVATMPDWLAEALVGINDLYRPMGGKKRSAADDRLREMRQQVTLQERDLALGHGSLIGQWVAANLQLIRIANDSGCWNLTIYQVTKDLARFGWDYDSVETVVLAAAQPWSDREERNAIATIRSGFKNLARNSGRRGAPRD